MWLSILGYLASAVALSFVAGAVLFRVYCWRRHLPNSPRENLLTRFAAERELMLTDLISEYGLTCELGGYLVTADPKLAKVLLLSKVGVWRAACYR